MIDTDGFIANDSQQTSTSVRENIQNKNLLKLKGDLYTSSGVLHLGKEGELLGGGTSGYGYAQSVNTSGSLDFRARKCLNCAEFLSYKMFTIVNDNLTFYPFDFLGEGENSIVSYQITLSLDSSSGNLYSFAPITFLKKKTFSNYFQINFTPGVNDENYYYRENEKYYRYVYGNMVQVSIGDANSFSQALSDYGFLYTKKFYSIFGYGSDHEFSAKYLLRIDLDEEGIYGVYQFNLSNKLWEKLTTWYQISCIKIQ